VRLEGLGQLKNPVTSSGVEPTTFRLVASCKISLSCYEQFFFFHISCSKAMNNDCTDRAAWCCSNAVDMYPGGARFET
jgi:hypothetical protein